MSECISLNIKSLNQCSPDYKIECNLDLTILSLKELIHKEHPSTPKIEDQKLIYFGQLLADDTSLRLALRHPPENDEYTLHLVYPSQNISLSEKITDTNIKKQNMSQNTMESTGVRRRNINESTSSQPLSHGQNRLDYNSFMSQYNSQLSTDPSQQLAAFQQMYSQYMASYFQYIQSAQAFQSYQSVPLPTNQPPPSVSQIASTVEQPVRVNTNDVPVVEPENRDEPQDAIRNAAGGLFGEEIDERRDWLDSAYNLIRFCIILSIVYFYSNTQRFVTVLAFCIFVFMYQQNLFGQMFNIIFGNDARLDQNIQGPNNNANRPREPTPTDDRDETQSEESSGGDQTPDGAAEVSDINNAVEVRATQHSIIALSWTFLTGFFSSLIPENPELI